MYMIEIQNGYDDPIIIYDDRYTDEEVLVFNPHYVMEDNSAGSLTFTLAPTNKAYGLDRNGNYIIRRMTTDIYIRKYNRQTGQNPIIWGGRVVSDSYDFYNNRLITCEGSLAFLNDTDQDGFLRDVNVLQIVVQYIRRHNRWLSFSSTNDRWIYVRINGAPEAEGVVNPSGEVTSPDNWTSDDITVVDIWSALSSQTPMFECDNISSSEAFSNILDYYGGHMYLEYVEEFITMYGRKVRVVKRFLHWVSSDSLHKCTQQIVFGENLLNYSSNYDSSDFYTVVLPLGCSLSVEERQSAASIGIFTQYLTVNYAIPGSNWPPATPDAQMIIDNDNNLTPYVGGVVMDSSDPTQPATPIQFLYRTQGWRLSVQKWNDVTDVKTLLEKAKIYLKSAQFNDLTIDVSAADLVNLGVDIADGEEEFKFLDMVDVVSPPHGLNSEFLITKVEVSMDQPGSNTFSLNLAQKTHYPRSLTEILYKKQTTTDERIGNITNPTGS